MMFGEKAAKDIFIHQQFSSNGRNYTVWNVYVKDGQARINVGTVYFPGMGTAPGWFTPGDGIEWFPNTLGEGMKAVTPEGYIVTIEGVQPNRACHCVFEDGTRKSFREENLNPHQ